MSTVPARPYRGRSAEERKTERRERLLDAALEVVAEKGWHSTTVRDVCSRAKLTERYFYEAFGDRQGVLLALFDHVSQEVATILLEAVAASPRDDATQSARAAISAFVDALADDPRRMRILITEAPDDTELQARRQGAVLAFAHLVRDQAAEFYGVSGRGKKDAELTSHVLVGGLGQLLLAWHLGDVKVSRERLIEHVTKLFVAVAPVRSGSAS
ncbi:TetR/AcrR family transcriptional regulator [Svornostia abyssi]|uniref:TetR/AcrR family transcriptional regulator n=1 Tax=Svornostia abyssi TaxID=2898438 RepID=A0ABY5PID3_9ACTN|nr:TetR/AcrR family transcriptional regulator [Parviterribacteraceae bacterium J379]